MKQGTLREVSCTRLHDHCDLTCTSSLLSREGHKDLTVLKQDGGNKGTQCAMDLRALNELPRQFKLLDSLKKYSMAPIIPRGALAPTCLSLSLLPF